jgi:excisionase family DNA binding protein
MNGGVKVGEPLYTLKEAAKLTRVSLSTWRGWVLHRKVDFVKVGGRVLIPQGGIAKMLADGYSPAKSPAESENGQRSM